MDTEKKKMQTTRPRGRPRCKSSKRKPINITNDNTYTEETNGLTSSENPSSNNPLVIMGEKQRGLYECDYCRSDITQSPRIRCAICLDFDLCLKCFASNDPNQHKHSIVPVSASSKKILGHPAYHDHTHGYRVADSTRFPLFPSLRGVRRELSEYDVVINDDNYYRNVENDTVSNTNYKVDTLSNQNVDKKKSNINFSSKEEMSFFFPVSTNDELRNVIHTPLKNTHREEVKNQPINHQHLHYVVTDDPKSMWTVESDLLLLDAIETHGLGNWVDISEAVSGGPRSGANLSKTKNDKECMERYIDDYLGRYGHILPPNILVKSQEDISYYKEKTARHTGNKRQRMEHTELNATFPYSPRINPINDKFNQYHVIPTSSLPDYQDLSYEPYIPNLPGVSFGIEVNRDHAVRSEKEFIKESEALPTKIEADKLRADWIAKKLNEKHGLKVLPPRLCDIHLLPGSEMTGFMPRRFDFDIEYDNEAELILADMEFSASDHPQERAIKLRVLEIYNRRLDAREKRKQFVIERDLLNYRRNQSRDQSLPSDERELVNRMRIFARFHSKDEHDAFIESLLRAKRLRKEISRLQMYRRLGIRSLVEAERYDLDKKCREAHRMAVLQNEIQEEKGDSKRLQNDGEKKNNVSNSDCDTQLSGIWKQYRNKRKNSSIINEDKNIECAMITQKVNSTDNKFSNTLSKPSILTAAADNVIDTFGQPGYDLLTSKEVRFCQRLQLLPEHYLHAKKMLIRESITEGIFCDDKSTCGSIFKIDVEKKHNIFEFVMRSGWLLPKVTFNNDEHVP